MEKNTEIKGKDNGEEEAEIEIENNNSKNSLLK